MRIKYNRHCAFLIVLANVALVYYTWKLFQSLSPLKGALFDEPKPPTKPTVRHVSKLTTVVIRDFELQDNDVSATVQSFVKVFPNIQILILTNGLPYPPLQLGHPNETLRNVRVVDLQASLHVPYQENPLNHIRTNYVLFVPDSTRILHRQSVQQMIQQLSGGGGRDERIVAVPYTLSRNLSCSSADLRLRQWTLRFSAERDVCDFVGGKHATMVELGTLYKLSNPFLLPHPHSLYLQTSYLKYKVKILHGVQFQDGKPLFHSHHAQRQKHKADQLKLKRLYETYSIKQVIKENGAVENYGCTRETSRCFGSIINYTPSYVYENKTTPPCCLANLRKTARHVFGSLHEAGIRYWLDGGSLLGAMRNGDVIPWDYDVDVGFYRDDLLRCVWLKRAKSKPVVDTKGFLWEKATEGNFYRVHYSKTNRIYVNLFPYYARNGTMIKDSWFTSHRSLEFPDHYLHPMSSVEFVGRHVASPNNIRDFLEHKYGRDAVENRNYPDFKFKFTK